MPLRAKHVRAAVGLATALLLAACGSNQAEAPLDPAAHAVALPGAMRQIGFDDIAFSTRLDRVLVPARQSGLYLIDPQSGDARRIGHLGSADSADEGHGLVYVLDRGARVIDVVDPRNGRVVASADTSAPPDYVRYVAATAELWVTEPAAATPGIEIFAAPANPRPAPRHVGFVVVPGGPEAFAWSASRHAAYTHAGRDLVRIDLHSRRVTARWPTGCRGTHGFPRIDERRGLLLASCDADGKAVLLDADDGRPLGSYEVGGGVSLPGYSARTEHFYLRADPGPRLATLAASRNGLTSIRDVQVPPAGHCLTADHVGHYWTCDAAGGRVLRFSDP